MTRASDRRKFRASDRRKSRASDRRKSRAYQSRKSVHRASALDKKAFSSKESITEPKNTEQIDAHEVELTDTSRSNSKLKKIRFSTILP